MRPNPELTRDMVPNLRVLAPNLLVAGVLPIIGYALLRPHVSSDAVALAAVLVFPVIEIGVERLRRGYLEPIGLIALVGIAAALTGAIVFHGSALLLKVRESLLTGLFGLGCLVSLLARRPVMFYLGRAFATGGDPIKTTEFDQIWALPGVPRRFRFVTVLWGIALVTEAGVRTVLALTLQTQLFLIVAQIVNWVTLGCLLWYTVVYSRAGEQEIAALTADEDTKQDASYRAAFDSAATRT